MDKTKNISTKQIVKCLNAFFDLKEYVDFNEPNNFIALMELQPFKEISGEEDTIWLLIQTQGCCEYYHSCRKDVLFDLWTFIKRRYRYYEDICNVVRDFFG